MRAVKTTESKSEEYFAAIDDPVELAEEMKNKIEVWREYCDSQGYTALWQKKLSNYYGFSQNGNSSQRVNEGGTEGELSLIKVNDLHNLVQNQLVMVTSQRPAGIARATNIDTQSLKAARIGSAIAEFYMSQAGFETKFVQATEIALLCDEGFIDLFWDKKKGKEIAYDPESGVIREGDCILRTHGPWNVARDPGLTVEQNKWHIITFKENKFDIVASYPKFREQILASADNLPAVPMDTIPEGSDAIYCHLLVHEKTASVPEGRYALLVGDQIVLDTSLPYGDEYPVKRIAPSDTIDGCIGYSAANDILALEEVTDALHSIVVTNQTSFGGQCIVGPEGGNLNPVDLAKGVRYFELPSDLVDKFKPLDLCHTQPEIFQYIQTLGAKKEQAVGVNSVVRGQPEGQLAGASGAALALIQTQAISFNSGIQRSYLTLLSSTMTSLIGILRAYADTPRVATIVGKNKAQDLKEFKYTGESLESVSSIVYELVNPISQTFGGRLTMAQDLLKAGQIKSPKQYINVVATGNIEVLIRDDVADGFNILEENEKLTEGEDVKAIITEIHADHIKSHMSVIASHAAKADPELIQRTLAHIQEHADLWMQASVSNPAILQSTGQLPLQPPMPQMMPQGPPQPGAPQGIGKEIGGGEPPTHEVGQPSLPNVAGTKEKPAIPGVSDVGIA